MSNELTDIEINLAFDPEERKPHRLNVDWLNRVRNVIAAAHAKRNTPVTEEFLAIGCRHCTDRLDALERKVDELRGYLK